MQQERTTEDQVLELCDAIARLYHEPTASDTVSIQSNEATLSDSELNSSMMDLSSTESLTNYYILDWRAKNGPGTVSENC